MGLQRALVLARGGPPLDAARALIESLPKEIAARSWRSILIHRPSGPSVEIDLVILGYHALYAIEVKAYRGTLSANGQAWMVTSPDMPDGARQLMKSPLDQAREGAKLLATLLGQELGIGTGVRVEPLVVLAQPDVDIQLPDELRSHVLKPEELVSAVELGELPGGAVVADGEPLAPTTVAAVVRVLDEARGRPRPGLGRFRDELPIAVRDLALALRDRVPEAESHAVLWFTACGFVRALEERKLVPSRIAGEGAAVAEQAFFAERPERTAGDYVVHAVDAIAALPAGEAVLAGFRASERPLLSDADARSLLDFFRRRGPSGKLRWSFARDPWTDLFEQSSPRERSEHGLVSTPDFVGRLLLDRTLSPALAERGSAAARVIDPACGSGDLLCMAFERLYDHLVPTCEDAAVAASRALDGVYGTDITPAAVLLTRIRLVLAWLERAGFAQLADAPSPPIHVEVADSLLVGKVDDAGEGVSAKARDLLGRRYDVVVTEPPFVSCRDAFRQEQYRRLYRSGSGKFSLVVPFIERCFDLAADGGLVGVFVSSSFMQRAFGKVLVEKVLPSVEVTSVIDTSTAYIPGHGTPTMLLFGRCRQAQSSTVRVVVAKGPEPIPPHDPERGEVWTAIVGHLDEVGYEDTYISVAEVQRSVLATHPWSLGTSDQLALMQRIRDNSQQRLSEIVERIRVGASSGQDAIFVLPEDVPQRLGIEPDVVWPRVSGESIRDWAVLPTDAALCAYDRSLSEPLTPAPDAHWWRYLWKYRTLLRSRDALGRPVEPWWAWSGWRKRSKAPRLLSPVIGRQNDFAVDSGGMVVARTVSCIEMSASATEEDAFAILGYLNSSLACFWLKQTSFQKMSGPVRSGEGIYDFASGLQGVLIPRVVIEPGPVRDEIVALAERLHRAARDRAACAPARVLAAWDRRSRDSLLDALGEAQMTDLACLRGMVCDQEDLDWLLYEALGLVQGVPRRAPGAAVPEQRPFAWLSDEPPVGLDRRLVEPWKSRRTAMNTVPVLQTLESPAYKRRFGDGTSQPIAIDDDKAEGVDESRSRAPGERRAATHGQEYRRRMADAYEVWILERMEDVFRGLDAPRALSAEDTAKRVMQMAGAGDVASLLGGLRGEGLFERLRALGEAHAVPYLAALRYTASGLAKRAIWERMWEMQRAEDQGEDVQPPVPPAYEARDYRGAMAFRHRGKLDVPTERFIRYPGAEVDGSGALYGWAGWNAEERATALRALYEDRVYDGWGAERLLPLLAGILDLVAEEGAEAFEHHRRFVDQELAVLGLSADALRAFRPPSHVVGEAGHS